MLTSSFFISKLTHQPAGIQLLCYLAILKIVYIISLKVNELHFYQCPELALLWYVIKSQMPKQNGKLPLRGNFPLFRSSPIGYLKALSQMRAFLPEKNKPNILNIRIFHMQTKLHKAISCVRTNKMPLE